MQSATPSALPDAIEVASRDEIEALQLQRLRWSLNHAYTNVAHYQQKFDDAGVHPDDLRSVDDSDPRVDAVRPGAVQLPADGSLIPYQDQVQVEVVG